MTIITYGSQIKWIGKTTPPGIFTLLDTGSENCYIDIDLANFFKWNKEKLQRSKVGFGGEVKIRYGPFYPIFILKFKKTYKRKAKTYIMNLPQGFGVVISGNWIRETKFPVQKIIEYRNKHEY